MTNTSITLTVLLTDSCNKKCSFCRMKQGDAMLSFEAFQMSFEKLLTKYGDTQVQWNVIFMGGEPLLNFGILCSAMNYLRNRVPCNFLGSCTFSVGCPLRRGMNNSAEIM